MNRPVSQRSTTIRSTRRLSQSHHHHTHTHTHTPPRNNNNNKKNSNNNNNNFIRRSSSIVSNSNFQINNHDSHFPTTTTTTVQRNPFTLKFHDVQLESRYTTDCYFNNTTNSTRHKVFALSYSLFYCYGYVFIAEEGAWFHPFVIFSTLAVILSLCVVAFTLLKTRRAQNVNAVEWSITFIISMSFVGQLLARTTANETQHNVTNFADVFTQTIYCSLLIPTRHFVLARSYIPGCIVAIVYITIEHGALYATWVLFVVFPVAIGYVLDMQARTQFLHVDRAERRLRRIAAHTELMEATLLAALPHTARDQLLGVYHHASTLGTPAAAQRVVGCLYPDTAVVVTDACGFTAWATRTVPLDVVYMLGRLFRELDAAAMSWGVEKLCTVGDSYVGVVFGPAVDEVHYTDQQPARSMQHPDGSSKSSSLSSGSNSSGKCDLCHADDDEVVTDVPSYCPEISRRVLNAVHFAIDAARLPHQLDLPLRNRVGVQVGAVYAGFVGYAPPVFDAFGTAVVEAKELEASGVPSRVHVSPIVLTHCERSGCGSAVDVTSTSRGVLISSWANDGDLSEVPSNPSLGLVPSVVPSLWESVADSVERRRSIVKVLRKNVVRHQALARGGAEVPVDVDMSDDDLEEEASSLISVSAPHIRTFHRSFRDNALEADFYMFVQREKRVQMNILFALMLCMLFCIVPYVLFQCPGARRDRFILTIHLLVFIMWCATSPVIFNRGSPGLHFVVTHICYICGSFLLTFGSYDCFAGGVDEDQTFVFLVDITTVCRDLIPLVCFTAPRWLRLCGFVVNCTFGGFLDSYLRAQLRPEGDFSRDNSLVAVLMTIVNLFLAFTIEEMLRRAFIASRKVEDAIKLTGSYAKRTRATLEMMLPSHVVDYVLSRDAQRLLDMSASTPPPVYRLLDEVPVQLADMPLTPHFPRTDDPTADDNVDVVVWEKSMTSVASFEDEDMKSKKNKSENNASHVLDEDVDAENPIAIWDYSVLVISFVTVSLRRQQQTETNKSLELVSVCKSDDDEENNNDNNNNKNGMNVNVAITKVGDDSTKPEEKSQHCGHQCSDEFAHVTEVLNEMERVAHSHGVVKIKSTGTTLLLVAGVGDDKNGASDRNITDATQRMCRAVLDMVRVGRARVGDVGGDVRAGVHAGPCFGAVMDTRGLTFDVFGDTVNTASRVAATSRAGCVRVSPIVVDCLGGPRARRGLQVCSAGCVDMKGKGITQMYEVDFPSGSAAL
eukprot:PhM_4_TR10023/c4_g1_i12/m.94957